MIRFQPGPIFSGFPADYWVPKNWFDLDNTDLDLGGSGPLLVDVPDATPSHLVVALGKDGNAYLVNRDNLGGITAPVASAQVAVAGSSRQQQPIEPNRAPMLLCAPTRQHAFGFSHHCNQSAHHRHRLEDLSGDGCGSPFVTSTDGTSNMIVWVVGTGDSSGGRRSAITRLRRRYRCCCLCWRRRERTDGRHAFV